MKVCVLQPKYLSDTTKDKECFDCLTSLFDGCDSSCDIIVAPEYSDVPVCEKDKKGFDRCVAKYRDTILEKAKETAVRCNAVVFVNASFDTEDGHRNTTYAIDRTGNIAGKYFKAHPAPSETKRESEGGMGLDVGYSYEFNEPYVIEIDGVRYGFMTCYDFYFYEAYAALARKNVDVIIGTSHQRTDTHQALDIIGQFLSYNTGAYLIRSAVSLGPDSPVCGSSMIVAPDGTILCEMENKVGIGTAEIDPHKKYLKPAGFGGKLKQHYEYIEEGRRPWNYRPAGPAMCLNDDLMPYPRVCAHRGFSTVAPENSLPAYGAAVALGADEIEFDLWESADGVIVSCHDRHLSRISTGDGFVTDRTLEELRSFDFGVKMSEKFAGLKIATFEDILKKFACQTVMNVHVKARNDIDPLPDTTVIKIIDLIRKYDCEKYIYIMSGNREILKQFKRLAPDFKRCAGAAEIDGKPADNLIDRAIELGCEKIQLFKPHFKFYEPDYLEKTIKKAHEHGIIVNMFYSDDYDEALKFLEMGCDTILSNNFLPVSKILEKYRK